MIDFVLSLGRKSHNQSNFEMRNILFTVMAALSLAISAQDIIVTNDGTSIKAYNLDIGEQAVFYTLTQDPDANVLRIARKDVLIIKKQDGQKIVFNTEDVAEVKENNASAAMPAVDISQYHGFLLTKGNAVYVEAGATEYERAGGNRLRELLAKDGFWQVAASEEQAHFIIKYIVHLEGQDHVEFYFLDRRNRLTNAELMKFKRSRFGNGWTQLFTSEDNNDNIKAAETLHERIKKVQKQIESTNNYQSG